MPSIPKPLGYWLKHLHNLIDAQLTTTLADDQLDRRQWQLLNTLSRGSYTWDELRRAVAPFLADDEPNLHGALDGPTGLFSRGWTRRTDGFIALTEEGAAAHARLADQINQSRAAVLGDLTEQQYIDTVRVLSIMAGNVEADLAARRATRSP
jgi:hypothetical protein